MNPVSFLNYGLIGLCGLIIWLFSKVLAKEQERDGEPRDKIIKFSWIFIFLSVVLAGTGLTLELFRIANEHKDSQAASDLQSKLNQSLVDNAACKERATNDEALIARLDKQLAHLEDESRKLPSSAEVDVGNHTETVSLPANTRIQQAQLQGIQEARSGIRQAPVGSAGSETTEKTNATDHSRGDRLTASSGVIKDSSTGLWWTENDNGSDIAWSEAQAYCSALRTSASGGWRAPSVAELRSLFDSNQVNHCQSNVDCGVSPLFHLTMAGLWTNDRGILFEFVNGQTRQAAENDARFHRVLCVKGK
jgi:hypothetical protein